MYATTVRTQEVGSRPGDTGSHEYVWSFIMYVSDVVGRCLFSLLTEELGELFIREGTVIASLAFAHLCIA